MADEITTVPEEQALFQLSNGRYIMDEDQSRKMFYIKEAQPERSHQASGTGYFVCSAKRFNADMEAHPEWHEGKSTYNGYPSYKGLRLKGAV